MLLTFLIVVPSIAFSYVVWTDECSYAPSGKFDLRLAPDGISRFFNDNHACNPWRVVEPDASVQSMTILPYSSWTDAPPRAVTIERSGRLTISEPVRKDSDTDWPEWDYRERLSVNDPTLARTLLTSLSRLAQFNRLTTEDPDKIVARLESEGADITDPENYLVGSKIPCRGRMYDAGGVSLEVTTSSGEHREISLDSFCHSIAKDRAITMTWDARQEVFKAADFSGEHFVDELATTH